jgi:endonuclease/exonuclease/phosphatase family metal-dependent hydrolase
MRTVAAAVLSSLLVCGCNAEKTLEQLARKAGEELAGGNKSNSQASQPPATPVSHQVPVRHGARVTIATFNIQVFGTKKEEDGRVMDVLARIVRMFDVIAIQEVRSTDQQLIPRFVELVNADGSHYAHVIGPRLGNTSSKEQYVYLYDQARIELDPTSVYTTEENPLIHREPLVARFRVRGPPSEKAFTFTLVNVHTDPDETDVELDELAEVFRSVQQNGSREDDVILLGDLNEDDKHLGELARLPHIAWVISDQPTNTRRTKSYDNIVFNAQATVEYLSQSGVLDLQNDLGLTEQQALDVSDHMPVWAAFSAYEGGAGPIAAQDDRVTR